MKFHSKLIISLATALCFSLGTLMGTSSADQPPCYQYNPNGFQTSTTPVFNDICGVPAIGNESNFVRIRQDATGNDEDSTGNPDYSIGGITSACNTGDKFDLWNYLHNNASSDYNDNGSGSAVAHDVQSLMQAPLGQTNSQFNFSDTVSASNAAATVTDSASLTCNNGKQVQLSLVPSSVHIIDASENNGNWQNLPDSTINNPYTIGSPTLGSGDMWGCWNYRVVVIYQVTVTQTPPAVTATCNLFSVTPGDNRTVQVNQFNYTATNAAFQSVVIDWGDSSGNTTLTSASSVIGQTHQYSSNGSYNITATITFTVPGQPDVTSGGAAPCAAAVSFTSPTTPGTTTTTTTASTPPTALVNTGPGSVVGLFAGVSALGAGAYRWMLGRRLSRQ